MKVGLVLEGGAMRGMYTAGVLDTFMENNINVDGIVGVSAGALFGVNFLSNQKGRAIRYNKRFTPDKRYMGLYPLLREGNLVSIDFAYGEVPRKLDIFDDEEFQKSTIPFYAVLTNIETGKPEYVKINSVFEQMDILRASGSMPFVSKPVKIGDGLYLDGGVSDSIPFKWMKEQGYDKLIVILTRDISYVKGPMPKAIAKTFYRKYPDFLNCMLNRHNEYNNTLKELKEWESRGDAFVIRPSAPIEIDRIEKNPEVLQSVYDMGISDCKKVLGSLTEYLK